MTYDNFTKLSLSFLYLVAALFLAVFAVAPEKFRSPGTSVTVHGISMNDYRPKGRGKLAKERKTSKDAIAITPAPPRFYFQGNAGTGT